MILSVMPPENRDSTPRTESAKVKPIRGKTFIVGLLGTLVLVIGFVFWAGMSGGSRHVPLSKPGVGFSSDEVATASPSAGPLSGFPRDAGALKKSVASRKVRDELRERILAGWANAPEPEVAAAAKAGRFVPAPTAKDGTGMDPAYVQDVVREEFLPMAKACFEELRSRKKNAEGRVEMRFTVVADEKFGGIIEDVEADHRDGGLADERMTTCMRESMSTLAFRAPARGGYVTIVYPFDFLENEPPDAAR